MIRVQNLTGLYQNHLLADNVNILKVLNGNLY